MLDIRSKAVTIDNCSSLFATICHCSPLFALFETIRTIRDYSLFATIRYSVFQTPIQLLLNIDAIHLLLYFSLYFSPYVSALLMRKANGSTEI